MIRTTEMPDNVAILEITQARLTAVAAPEFKQQVLAQIEAGHTRLVLDLSNVSFIDSTGLGALVGILKRIGNRGDVTISGLQPAPAQMFRLTRMDKVFRIFRTSGEAASALASG